MSYTNKQVIWESCSNTPVADVYGDITRAAPVSILARKQPTHVVIKTDSGSEVVSKSVYYVDPRVETHALSISRKDKLDGELVESIYVMCDLRNRPRMVRFYTI